MNLKVSLCLVALAGLATAARAELVFEKTEIELHPAATDETAVAHFKYQNKGGKVVAIKSVNTSCGCTAASAKPTAGPGEKGEVTATFKIGDRTGSQQKAITVTTDDPTQPATTLNLKVVIPQLLEIQPAFVFWQAGEDLKAKTIVAKVGKNVSIKGLDVESSSPQFVVKVDKASSGEYRINVDPHQTSEGATATLTFKPTLGNGRTKMFYATARVIAPVTGGVAQPNAGPLASQPGKAVTAPTTVATKGKIDACTLLTGNEIKSVQGEPLKDTKSSATVALGLAVSQCYFLLSTASNSISLTVMQKGDGPDAHDLKQSWKEIFHHEGDAPKAQEEDEEKSHGPDKVEGLGEEAFWSSSRIGGELFVLKGNAYFRISVGGVGDQASKLKKSKELAEKILTRL